LRAFGGCAWGACRGLLTTYGLGFDPVHARLYAFDEGTEEIVLIQ
jgi:hypothetical protein